MLVLGTATVGCQPAVAAEARGTVTQKLLPPEPLMVAKASAETTAAYGITEWRFYRGRGAILLAGYTSKKGKAVKGLGTLFTRTKTANIDNLQLNVADGSKFHGLASAAKAGVTTNGSLPDTSQGFLRRAFLDMARVGVAASRRARGLGVTPTPADACAFALANATTAMTRCITGDKTNSATLQECNVAAQLANVSLSTCHGFASPLGGVVDPIPAGLTTQNLPNMCIGDPTCLNQVGSLVKEEGQCGGALACPGFFDSSSTNGGATNLPFSVGTSGANGGDGPRITGFPSSATGGFIVGDPNLNGVGSPVTSPSTGGFIVGDPNLNGEGSPVTSPSTGGFIQGDPNLNGEGSPVLNQNQDTGAPTFGNDIGDPSSSVSDDTG